MDEAGRGLSSPTVGWTSKLAPPGESGMRKQHPMNLPPGNPARRRLLGGSMLAFAGLTLACSRSEGASEVAPAKAIAPLVTIVGFSNDGKRLKSARLPKSSRASRLEGQLSGPSFMSLGRAAPSVPSAEYDKWKEKGVYACICCDTPFRFRAKFDSGTAGRASGNRSRRRNPGPRGPPVRDASHRTTCPTAAMRTLATSSTTDRSRRLALLHELRCVALRPAA